MVLQDSANSYLAMYRSLLMINNTEAFDSTIRRRISYLAIMIGGMLLYWLWEAQLITYFSFQPSSLPFTSLRGLLDNSNKKVTVDTLFTIIFRCNLLMNYQKDVFTPYSIYL